MIASPLQLFCLDHFMLRSEGFTFHIIKRRATTQHTPLSQLNPFLFRCLLFSHIFMNQMHTLSPGKRLILIG